MSFSGSEDDEPVIDITQWAPRQNNTRPDKPAPPQARAPSPIQRTQSPDVQVISSSESEPESESASESEGSIIHVASFRERDVQVVIDRPSDFDPEDYEDWTIGGDVVHRVVKVLGHGKRIVYVVEFMDLHKERVSLDFYKSSIFYARLLHFTYNPPPPSTLSPSSLDHNPIISFLFDFPETTHPDIVFPDTSVKLESISYGTLHLLFSHLIHYNMNVFSLV